MLFALDELFRRGKLATQREQLHGKVELLNGREGGGKTDVFVFRVLSVGEGCACAGELYARLLAQLHDLLGAAVGQIDADEISAHRLGPGDDSVLSEVVFKAGKHRFKSRAEL